MEKTIVKDNHEEIEKIKKEILDLYDQLRLKRIQKEKQGVTPARLLDDLLTTTSISSNS